MSPMDEKSMYRQSKIADGPKFLPLNHYNSATDCLISPTFGIRVRYGSAEFAKRLKCIYHEIQDVVC